MTTDVAALLAGAVLVTGNRDKLAEARRLCGAELGAVELDLPEIQSLDALEILQAKADAAARHVAGPLIVEETALELDALQGFPGPLVKWMLAAVGAEGIARTGIALGSNAATARCLLLMVDGGRRCLAEGTTTGQLVLPARGDHGFGWDPVFQPTGRSQTYAEMTPAEKDRLSHRARAWQDLVARLRQQRGPDDG